MGTEKSLKGSGASFKKKQKNSRIAPEKNKVGPFGFFSTFASIKFEIGSITESKH